MGRKNEAICVRIIQTLPPEHAHIVQRSGAWANDICCSYRER